MADPETRDLVNQAEAWLTQFHHTPEPAWAMVNELYIALSEAQQRLVTLEAERDTAIRNWRSGLMNSHVEFEDARTLLGLSDSEGT